MISGEIPSWITRRFYCAEADRSQNERHRERDNGQNAGDFENGSEVPREMGINERAINRVNGRRHAILPRRRFQGDGLLTGADWHSTIIWSTHELPPSSTVVCLPHQSCTISRRSARRSYFAWCKKRGMSTWWQATKFRSWDATSLFLAKNFGEESRDFILNMGILGDRNHYIHFLVYVSVKIS